MQKLLKIILQDDRFIHPFNERARDLRIMNKPLWLNQRDVLAPYTSRELEVQPHTLALLPPGAVPKTSSGKIQRFASRAALVSGELPVLWRHDSSAANAAVTQTDGATAAPAVQAGAPVNAGGTSSPAVSCAAPNPRKCRSSSPPNTSWRSI